MFSKDFEITGKNSKEKTQRIKNPRRGLGGIYGR